MKRTNIFKVTFRLDKKFKNYNNYYDEHINTF